MGAVGRAPEARAVAAVAVPVVLRVVAVPVVLRVVAVPVVLRIVAVPVLGVPALVTGAMAPVAEARVVTNAMVRMAGVMAVP